MQPLEETVILHNSPFNPNTSESKAPECPDPGCCANEGVIPVERSDAECGITREADSGQVSHKQVEIRGATYLKKRRLLIFVSALLFSTVVTISVPLVFLDQPLHADHNGAVRQPEVFPTDKESTIDIKIVAREER